MSNHLLRREEYLDKIKEYAAESEYEESAENPTISPVHTEIDETVFDDGKILVAELMTVAGLTPSRSEARRLIVQGGVSINGEKVTDGNATLTKDVFAEDVVIKKGKKVFHKVILK